MKGLINDVLVGYTKTRVGKDNVLTYSFRKGELSSGFRARAKELIDEIDDRLTGLSFKRIKPSTKSDLIIGYGDLPSAWENVLSAWEV